jgi:hypothetical protein
LNWKSEVLQTPSTFQYNATAEIYLNYIKTNGELQKKIRRRKITEANLKTIANIVSA